MDVKITGGIGVEITRKMRRRMMSNAAWALLEELLKHVPHSRGDEPVNDQREFSRVNCSCIKSYERNCQNRTGAAH